jgi:hypothetical protein
LTKKVVFVWRLPASRLAILVLGFPHEWLEVSIMKVCWVVRRTDAC